jgi:quinol monooxygenase YgiN
LHVPGFDQEDAARLAVQGYEARPFAGMTKMYVISAEIRTRSGCAARYAALLEEVVTALSVEPCFVSFAMHRSADDSDLFLLYEVWSDASAYAELRAASVFSGYLARRESLVLSVRRSDWSLTRTVLPSRNEGVFQRSGPGSRQENASKKRI